MWEIDWLKINLVLVKRWGGDCLFSDIRSKSNGIIFEVLEFMFYGFSYSCK